MCVIIPKGPSGLWAKLFVVDQTISVPGGWGRARFVHPLSANVICSCEMRGTQGVNDKHNVVLFKQTSSLLHPNLKKNSTKDRVCLWCGLTGCLNYPEKVFFDFCTYFTVNMVQDEGGNMVFRCLMMTHAEIGLRSYHTCYVLVKSFFLFNALQKQNWNPLLSPKCVLNATSKLTHSLSWHIHSRKIILHFTHFFSEFFEWSGELILEMFYLQLLISVGRNPWNIAAIFSQMEQTFKFVKKLFMAIYIYI